MKQSKKFKLLSAISAAVITSSLITTSCAVINKNNTTINEDVVNIQWIKRSSYNASTSNEIINIVKSDNTSVFSRYDGLSDAVSITAPISSNSVRITITGSEPYSGTTWWDASCLTPKPELIDINTLNWKMRTFYNATDSQTIVSTIETDNSDSSGAGIVSWDDINVNATVVDSEISINIIVAITNTIYTGAVRWSAAIEKYENWSSAITSELFKTGSTLMALKQGRQVTLSFVSVAMTVKKEPDKFTLLTVPDAWLPPMSSAAALINYDSDTPTGMVWVNAEKKH